MKKTYNGKTNNSYITPVIEVNTVFSENKVNLSVILRHRYSSGARFNGSGEITATFVFNDRADVIKSITLDHLVTGQPINIEVYTAMTDSAAIPCRITLTGYFTTTDTPLTDDSNVGRNNVSFESINASFPYGIFPKDPRLTCKTKGFGNDTVITISDSVPNAKYTIWGYIYPGSLNVPVDTRGITVTGVSGSDEVILPFITEAEAAEIITDKAFVTASVSAQVGIVDFDSLNQSVDLYRERIDFSDDVKPVINGDVSPLYEEDSIVPSSLRTLFIQGFCAAHISYLSSAKYGATIQSAVVKVEGISVTAEGNETEGSFDTDTLTLGKTYNISIESTDSRGLTTVQDIPIECLFYTPPRIGAKLGEEEVIVHRCDADGNLDDTGSFIKIVARSVYSPLTGQNEANVQFRYYRTGDIAGEWQDASSSVVEGIIASGGVKVTFDEMEKYTVELSCPDMINTDIDAAKVIFYVPSARVFTHRSKLHNSFGFGGLVEEDNTVYIAESMSLKAENGINDVHVRSCIVTDGKVILRTAFNTFEQSSTPTLQVFHIFGAGTHGVMISDIVEGVIAVTSTGKVSFRGTDNVTATAANGNVTLTLPEGVFSNLIIKSNKKFREVVI